MISNLAAVLVVTFLRNRMVSSPVACLMLAVTSLDFAVTVTFFRSGETVYPSPEAVAVTTATVTLFVEFHISVVVSLFFTVGIKIDTPAFAVLPLSGTSNLPSLNCFVENSML